MGTHCPKSASSRTMNGSLPPSSSTTGVSVSAAAFMTRRPTPVDPDKDNLPAPAGDDGVTSLAVPVHDLHEVARRAHRVEARLDRAAVIQRAPAGVLGHFHHEGVTGEEVGEERVEDVVEG